ncbi:hypothetical protein [Leptolyngbya ohadii]|uniref:hypothetical protein n=1 Tax=Leptolyngbya ohadii TaxID=1962290 RepID=UPI000B5A06FA|nr:hypothetical protein [Leptolyngbya ohadii]
MKKTVEAILSGNSPIALPLVLAIAAIVLAIRKTGALLNPQFWAEDGPIFFLQQYEEGAIAIFKPYAGYLLLIPRLVALFADTFFSYAAVPLVYNLASLILTLIVAASVFSPRFQVRYKPLFALAIVLVPLYSNEVFLNITNVQWILALLPLIVLLKEEPDRSYGNVQVQWAIDIAAIVLCGLTGPFIVLMMPLFIWRRFVDRSHYRRIALLAVVSVSLIQILFIVSDSGGGQEGSTLLSLIGNIPRQMNILGYRVFAGLFIGIKAPYSLSRYFFVLYLILVFVMLRYAVPKKNYLIPFCLIFQALILLAAFAKFGDGVSVLIPVGDHGIRYFYIPYVMLTWSLLVLLESHEKPIRFLTAILLTLVVISSLTSGFRSYPFIDYNWKAYSQFIGKEDVTIPINPEGWDLKVRANPN